MNIIAHLFARSIGRHTFPKYQRQASEPLDHPCLVDLDSAAISDLPVTNYWIEPRNGQVRLIGEVGQ
jgi:hypothetical protein